MKREIIAMLEQLSDRQLKILYHMLREILR